MEDNKQQGAADESPKITINVDDEETNNAPAFDSHYIPSNRKRKVYGGMWGTPEMIVVGLGLAALAAMIAFFVFFVIPARRELSASNAKVADLNKKLSDAQARYGKITNTKDRVAELKQSADDFQSRFLSPRVNGEMAIYQKLSGLISAYGLTNTAGPDYAPLDTLELGRSQQKTEEGKGRAKLVSYFPGTYITVTLDGSYQNLRRFIREVESSSQFVVISSIEIEPSESTDEEKIDPTKPPKLAPPVNPSNPNTFQPESIGATDNAAKVDRGKTRGETVTLRIEMAAYFRRGEVAPTAAVAEVQR